MAQKGKAQAVLEYAVARALIDGVGLLPRRLAVAAGCKAGKLAYRFGGNLRRTGVRNLELAFPEKDAAERERILQNSFISLGRLLAEFSQFNHATPESLRRLVDYDGIEHLHAAKRRGKGVIILTMHLGAWEVLSFAHSALHEPLSFLVRPIDNPLIEEMVERRRRRFGNQPINKKAAARAALRVLRDGGTLGILADLNTQRHEGVFVPFFGHLACTTAGVATLALRTDAAVIPVSAPWDEKRGRFVFKGQAPILPIRTGDEKLDVEVNTAKYAEATEQHIRANPEQWLWIHKRCAHAA
ncbi:MAG: lysophospholipid acyltransferase family protein [Pyrinomonadaceae bacterium]